MPLSLLKVIGGILILAVGAEFLVGAAVSIARRVGISPLVIGLTIVSMGTSLPELVVSVDAVLQGSDALGVGNVVGSNISNITLILGLSALVRPMKVKAQLVRIEAPILVGVSLFLVLLVWDGQLARFEGGMLAVGVVGYLVYNVWAARDPAEAVREEFAVGLPSQHKLLKDLGGLVVGLAGLVFGADLLVDGAVHVAALLQVPKVVIGLTVVAVGTSLPELATSMLAAYRGNGDIAIGNAVGSCVLNVLGILGLTAAFRPLSTTSLTLLELGMLVGTAVLIVPFLRTDYILSRREGGALLFLYGGYLSVLFLGG